MNTRTASACDGSKPHSGFTLIELMVVVAIVALTLAAAAPSIADWMRALAVRGAADAMRSGLEKARMEALRRNTPMSFWLVSEPSGKGLSNACTLSSNGNSWVVSVSSPTGSCASQASTTVAPMLVDKWAASETTANAAQLQVTALNSNSVAVSSVTFTSLGQLKGTTPMATIRITSVVTGVRELDLILDPGGSVRMCDPATVAPDPRAC